MTTATRTRPSTPKKAAKKGRKQPKWTVITFKKIEEWRVKLGFTKSAMAEALGVTNSTFHNWRRGTTVPRTEQQEEIAERIAGLEKSAVAGNGTVPKPKKKATKVVTKKKAGHRKKATAKKKAGRKKAASSGNRRVPNKTRTSSHQGIVTPVTPVTSAYVPDTAIGAITAAWITNQSKPVSAGSVVKFIEEIGTVL